MNKCICIIGLSLQHRRGYALIQPWSARFFQDELKESAQMVRTNRILYM